MQRIKKEIGQDTPKSINTIIIRQHQVPGEKNLFYDSDLIKVQNRWIINDNHQLHLHRPINAARWAVDPKREEARVLAQLHADADSIADQYLPLTGTRINTDNVSFSISVGKTHESLGTENTLLVDEDVSEQLERWSARYGQSVSIKTDQAPVAEFLTGINMILFIDREGVKEYRTAFANQGKRRREKAKMRRRMTHQAPAKPVRPRTRR